MTKEMEALERRLEKLSAEVRRAAASGDRDRASALRAELREARRLWDASLDELEAEGAAPLEADLSAVTSTSTGPLLPARDQVHQALTMIGAPASPRLIVTVDEVFYAGRLTTSRLTSLRRDEERSFRLAPYARPYYLCAALTAELLSPVRGLLAISTWPMERRLIGPLSPRVDYLTAAISIGERMTGRSGNTVESRRLLWRFAANIPHAAASLSTMNPGEIVKAAQAELAIHEPMDSVHRQTAAKRARSQLNDAEQFFGTSLGLSSPGSTGSRRRAAR